MRTIPGYEGLYWADEEGYIVSARRQGAPGGRLRGHMGEWYLSLALCKDSKARTFDVHRLVALAWHGKPRTGQEVNHINGDKLDNRPKNLEWVTNAENHSSERALFLRRGEAHHNAKLSVPQVREIKALYAAGTMQKELAARFGITFSQISRIVRGENWAHLL